MKDCEISDIRKTVASCQYALEKFKTENDGEKKVTNDAIYQLMKTKMLLDKLDLAIEGRS